MHKVKAVLLAAAFTAGLPTIATAQRWDRDGQQGQPQGGPQGQPQGNRDRGDRGGQPDRGNWQRPQDQARPPAPPPQAQPPQQPPQPNQPPRGPDGRGFDRRDFNPADQGRRGDYRPDANDRRPDFRPGDHRPDPNWRGGQGFRDGRGPDVRDDRGRDFHGDRGPGFDRRPGFDRGPGGPGFDRGPGGRFDRGWRQDRRYDWRGYRDQHREAFRAPRYVAPRGWGYGYRRFEIGVRVPAFFFGQQYWIEDPWNYRLPPAYGPYRWVRYYNDVLLVDLTTGQVVDSIPDFFF